MAFKKELSVPSVKVYFYGLWICIKNLSFSTFV